MMYLKSFAGRLRQLVKKYPLLTFAVILAVAMIAASLVFAAKVKQAGDDFDTTRVLPQPVTPPSASSSQQFTAETIKEYDGKDGRKCYVAVDGIVYEISGKGQWQNGNHLPSSGQAYCGADLTQTIGKSPHGKSKLQELPKVGTFK